MFTNETRKIMREHKLLEEMAKDSNSYQYIRRKKEAAKLTIKELILFSENLPIDHRKEVFISKDIIELIKSVTRSEEEIYSNRFIYTDLIFSLIEYGLDIIGSEYQTKNKNSPHLSKVTLEHLQVARGICQDIINIVRDEGLGRIANENNQEYVFCWSDLMTRDKSKFTVLVFEIINDIDDKIIKEIMPDPQGVTLDKIRYTGTTKLVGDIFDHTISEIIGHVKLIRNISQSKGNLIIEIGNIKKEIDLTIKEINDKAYFFK